MSRYRIAAAARLRLLEIYDYSRRTFGEYHAEAYEAGIGGRLGFLQTSQKSARQSMSSAPATGAIGSNRTTFSATEEADDIVIRTILHVSQNLRASLFM